MKIKQVKKIIVSLFVLMAAFLPATVQAGNYDKYARIYPEIKERSAVSQASLEFLTYPFELLRWPIDKALVAIEKHHIDTKVRWAIDTLKDHGIHPRANVFNPSGGTFGTKLDFLQAANLKTKFPDVTAKTWVYWANSLYFRTGAELGWQDLTGSGLGFAGLIEYDMRPREHFYGIGPDSTRGDGSSYRMETTHVGTRATYDPNPEAFCGIRLPVDLESCEVIEERWAAWMAWDPLVLADSHAENLKSLKGLWIDCGAIDQYNLVYGARRMHRKLEAAGVDHVYEEFPDDHSAIDYRMDKSLPFLAKALQR